MDKTSDVRRRGGSGRFSAAKRQSGINGDGNSGVLTKSKKEKLRRLSSVGNKMDSLSLSTSSSKRIKLPKKFFDDDYKPVDHASVPRKLRSAIKKRACESVSPRFPHPRKLGHTVKNRVELKAKDCTKKFNPCMQKDSTGSPKEAAVGPITKEEEEAVETLYALAGMFPNHGTANDSIILKEKPSKTKFLPIPAPKDEDCSNTSKFESPPGGTMKILADSKKIDNELDNSAPLVNFSTIFAFSKDDSTIERLSCKPMAKLPPWLVNATCATQPLTEKDSSSLADRKKSWKTCTAHVYISRLIRDLKLPEGKGDFPIHTKPNEVSKKESLLANNNLQTVINSFAEKKSLNEVRSDVLLHKRLLHDQQQGCTTSKMYTSHKQNIDVFSNSGGRCGMEVSNVVNTYGNRAEPATRFHYLNPPAQDHMSIPQMLPQNSCSSTSYNGNFSAAQQVKMQLPPYYGMPFSGPSHMSASVLPKQQLWASQVPQQPHYPPSEVSAAHLHHNWQNTRHQSSGLSQTALPNSSRSKYVPCSLLEVFAPKYARMAPQQQQQFGPIASLLVPKGREPQWAPLGYEENGRGLYFPNNSSSLQMLCNEDL